MNEAGCPSCGIKGKRVGTITLRSLLKPDRQASVGDNTYFFCGSAECETVYFADEGARAFSKADMTVRVGIKESSSPRPVCYCFGHDIEEIFGEVERTGKSTVVADIRNRIREEGCSCETRNPQGVCCLGAVQTVVEEALVRFGAKEGGARTEGTKKGCCEPGRCCR